MARTVDLSVSTRTKQYLVAGWVGWLAGIGLGALAFRLATGAWTGPLEILAVGLAGAALGVLRVRYRVPADEDGDAWDGVPRRQYTGRFARSGGISREEQERSLDDARDDGP